MSLKSHNLKPYNTNQF